MPKVRRQFPAPLNAALGAVIRAGISVLGGPDLAESLAVANDLGQRFGAAKFNRKRLARAAEHLAYAYPDWSDEQRKRCAVAAYQHLFMLAVETALLPRLLTIDGWVARIGVEQTERIIGPLTGKRPVMLVCGHCGNWEICGYALALLGFPLHALYRPLDLKPLDQYVRSSRSRSGLVLVDKFGAASTLPDLLSRRVPLGFVADQNAGVRGLFVPFFGRLASSYKAIGLLAIQHEAVIIVGAAHRNLPIGTDGLPRFAPAGAEALRYTMRPFDVITPEDYMAQPDPSFYIAARYRRAIEASVRSEPTQFLWMHRYWKSRPKYELAGKEIPSAVLKKIEQLPWMTQAEMDRVVANGRIDAQAAREGRAPRPAPADEADEGL